jgi:hypothetical protein
MEDGVQVANTERRSEPEANNAIRIGLIRKYQRIEGNVDCCASPYVRVCRQFECLWRDECQGMQIK